MILACFNSVVRFLMPELPDAQKQALAYAVKVPMMYSNVFVRELAGLREAATSRA